jgi:hypothetical protein
LPTQEASILEMSRIPLTEEIIPYFAAHPVPTLWSIEETLQEGPADIKNAVEKCLASIDNQTIDAYRKTPSFQFFVKDMPQVQQERKARIELFRLTLDSVIAERRLATLRDSVGIERPMPYNHPALEQIELHGDSLIDVSNFHLRDGGYFCNGYVFNLALILPQHNSSYWINQMLQRHHINARVRIRLDPFRIQPIEKHHQVEYKMLVYGIPLDWEKIRNLKDEQHGRWMPTYLNTTEAEFTDVCWKRRGNAIHFACEEVPKPDQITKRGSRYFHAVYDPDREHFIHVDGALRFYNAEELGTRRDTHVRKAGKLGTRVKIFQLDGSIARDFWCGIVNSFFVWNMDMEDYFNSRITLEEGSET